jgi:hypothetical protein
MADDDINQAYFDELKRRARESRVYSEHQLIGLMLAEILADEKHKSLYMRLAKKYNSDMLLQLAKNVAERKSVDNKGAYFMKLLQNAKNLDDK